jgi:hypothetical protein
MSFLDYRHRVVRRDSFQRMRMGQVQSNEALFTAVKCEHAKAPENFVRILRDVTARNCGVLSGYLHSDDRLGTLNDLMGPSSWLHLLICLPDGFDPPNFIMELEREIRAVAQPRFVRSKELIQFFSYRWDSDPQRSKAFGTWVASAVREIERACNGLS